MTTTLTADLSIREQTPLDIVEAPGGGVFNPDGTIDMVLIRPCNGRGPHGNIYEPEMLAREASKFAAWPMFQNHDTIEARKSRGGLPRSPADLAGEIRASWWEPDYTSSEDRKMGFGRGAVVGRCMLSDAMEALVRKIPRVIKLSVNAQATGKRRGQNARGSGNIVEGFVDDPENSSVDLVTRAGAGGRVAVLESVADPMHAGCRADQSQGQAPAWLQVYESPAWLQVYESCFPANYTPAQRPTRLERYRSAIPARADGLVPDPHPDANGGMVQEAVASVAPARRGWRERMMQRGVKPEMVEAMTRPGQVRSW